VKKVNFPALAGGQGKTTLSLLSARWLARLGHRVLAVDADSQANLTTYLGLRLSPEQPSLLEVLKREVQPQDAVYESNQPNLSLIPADDGLDNAQPYLETSGCSNYLLRNRLKSLSSFFDFCIIDSPPTRSLLSQACIGAADVLVIPAEAAPKGCESLLRTLKVLAHMAAEDDQLVGDVLSIVPFLDQWVGNNQTSLCKRAVAKLSEISLSAFGDDRVGVSIKTSDKYKRAIDMGLPIQEFVSPDLARPIQDVVESIAGVPCLTI